MDTAAIAGNAARKIIEELGFEMADVEYVREDGQMCINFYIRRRDGVDIEDCETVSRAIDEAVEKADPTKGRPYCLCVSTWGDRALKNDADFEYFMSVPVEVKLKKATEGKKKKFVGVLSAYTGDTVTVNINDQDTVFTMDNVEIIRPYIGF